MTFAIVDVSNLSNGLVEGANSSEVISALGTFGIPTDALPITPSGVLKTKEFQKWIQRRRNKDYFMSASAQSNATLGAPLSSFDKIDLVPNESILCGTGKPIMNHAGNQAFRSLIESKFEEYEAETEPKAKDAFARQVVSELKAAGNDFIKRDKDDWWIKIPDQEARDKVIKAFVSQRGKKKKLKRAPTEEAPPRRDSKPQKQLRHDGYYEEKRRKKSP